jgi:signal transduction histidine kinase
VQILIFFLLTATLFSSDEIFFENRYFIDSKQNWNMENIHQNRNFEAIENDNIGYQEHPVFMKTVVKNSGTEAIHKVFFLPRPTIDFVDIKVFKDNQVIKTFNYGDRVQNSLKEHIGKYTHFDLILEENKEYNIYIRLFGSGFISTNLTMIDSEVFLNKNLIETTIYALYTGLMFLLIYYNFLNYFAIKDNIFNIYSFYILSMLLSQLGTNNFLYFLNDLISPRVLSDLPFFTAIFVLTFLTLFLAYFFELKKHNKVLFYIHMQLIYFNIIFFVILLSAFLFDYSYYNLIIKKLPIDNFYFVNILIIFALIIFDTYIGLKKRVLGAFFIFLGNLITGIIILLYLIVEIYFQVNSHYLTLIVLISVLVDFAFVSYALSLRINSIYLKKIELDKYIITQSRQATFGAMIDTISHQWKQPLNELGLQLLYLETELVFKSTPPSKEFILENIEKNNNVLEFMSKTIDIFRNFFTTTNEVVSTDISEVIHNTILFLDATFEAENIKIEKSIENNILINCIPEEFSQVILNILVNSKDNFLRRETKEPILNIKIYKEDSKVLIEISDNGGGIHISPISKIFEHGISETKKGGVGMYITKLIVEKKLHGKIRACNIDNGAKFTIQIPTS